MRPYTVAGHCRRCGREFTYTRGGGVPGRPRLYCRPECRTPLSQNTGELTAICHGCGEEFSYRRGSGRPRTLCHRTCWPSTHRQRKGKTSFTCLQCGASFQAVSNGANKFCSAKCRKLAYADTQYARHALTCEQCGGLFGASKRSQRFCSPECWLDVRSDAASPDVGNHRARCRKFGTAYDPSVRRVQVLDRDGWVCWLCGDSIPRDAIYPNRQYGTIDHVIPVSKGGAHSWENVRAAHLSCNCSRGAKDA